MDNDYKSYDELLSAFEDKPKNPPGEKSTSSGDRPVRKFSSTSQAPQRKQPVRTGTPTSGVSRKAPPMPSNRVKPSAPPRSDAEAKSAQRERKGYKNGVYFSNPPKKITKDAQNQRKTTQGKRPVRNGRSVEMKDSDSGNIFQRFINKHGKKLLIELAVIAVVSIILCVYGIGCINDVLALNVDDVSVEVRIEEGMTDSDVIDLLGDEKLINNEIFCKLFIKFMALTDDSAKNREYIPGVYTLSPDSGIEKMLNMMKTNYRNAETVTLTFPEGWTIQEIAEKLESNDVCTASSFISTLQNVDFSKEYDFIAKIPNKDKRFRVLEGYMYPDTYDFYKGENPSSVCRRFLDNFDNKWTEEYQKKADKLGYSVDEIVIMASILEAEAANAEQMPKIASVLYNRLDMPNAFPLLQCDSTEDYLLDVIKPQLSSSIEDTQKYIEYRDRYDTYAQECNGLPIGAIGNPGGSAISAALNPSDTGYYYFRHDANGGIYYAKTFAQHEENGRIAAKVKKDD